MLCSMGRNGTASGRRCKRSGEGVTFIWYPPLGEWLAAQAFPDPPGGRPDGIEVRDTRFGDR